jgi:hypothetical protein
VHQELGTQTSTDAMPARKYLLKEILRVVGYSARTSVDEMSIQTPLRASAKFSRIAKSQQGCSFSILDCSPVDNESGEEPREPALNQSFATTRSWPPACKS